MSEDISMSNECHNHNAKAPCATCAGLGCPLCDPGTPKPQTIRDAIEALGPHLRDQGEVMRQDSRYRAYVGKPPVLLPGTIVDLHLEDGSHRILREDGSIVWDNAKREPGLRIVGYRLPALRHPPTDFKPLFDGKCRICGFARGHHSSCSAINPTREKRFSIACLAEAAPRQHVTDAAWERVNTPDMVFTREQFEARRAAERVMLVTDDEWDSATANRVERFCFRDYENDVVDTCTGRVYRRHGIGRGLSAENRKAVEDELETERLRLAACGVAAHGGSVDGCKPEYRSDALEAIVRLRTTLDDWEVIKTAEKRELERRLAEQEETIASLTRQLHSRRINEEPAGTKPVFRWRPLV